MPSMIPMRRAGVAASLAAAALLSAGCVTAPSQDMSAFRQARPRSILVLPPINATTDIRAGYGFLSTVSWPLAESGYYVFPVTLVDQTFRENGLHTAEEIHAAPLKKIREVFGADAVLYMKVTRYGASYQLVRSSLIARAEATPVDGATGATLWHGSAEAGQEGGISLNPVAGLLSGLLQQIANSGDGNARNAAVQASRDLLMSKPGGLLYGPYSPKYQSD
ncbi:MAG: DUF799 domain-containing protein [Candidatus Protistobacter heckmanni]|nr:DUF799 domain-containing protein [Candidatus Protistobacter heckmanni]